VILKPQGLIVNWLFRLKIPGVDEIMTVPYILAIASLHSRIWIVPMPGAPTKKPPKGL